VTAVLEATRSVTRRETPARLRLWTATVIVAAAAVLIATSLLMARAQEQARVIGNQAAPQAATASDLYFALSDLDAQVARMVLIDDADALAAGQIDALATYRERSDQVDADLQRLMAGAATAADRATALAVLGHLGDYREWAWQAMTVESQLPPAAPGKLPPAALGYYTQATNALHADLLPAAQRLRDSSRQRLDDAYTAQLITEIAGVALAVLLGGGLVVLLVILQSWLTRRFRRVLNPALLTATLLTVVLTLGACFVFVSEGQQLRSARSGSLLPYLALSHAQAVSYDAAADTSRYLISGNLPYYKQDFARKSACLTTGGACSTEGDPVDGGLAGVSGDDQVRDRWQAYQRDHEKIVALADGGKPADAIDALTGIRRGDASFDFSYYDDAVSRIAAARKQAFDDSLVAANHRVRGWTVIPIVAMGLVMVLAVLGVRRRLGEYR
jgi:hypothetical protein